MGNDFPAMIYHFALGQKIINSPDEMAKHKLDGWQDVPCEFTESEVNHRIAWHENEIAKLTRLKAAYSKKQDSQEIIAEPAGINDPAPRAKRKYTRRA
jgi:hypothetical protein